MHRVDTITPPLQQNHKQWPHKLLQWWTTCLWYNVNKSWKFKAKQSSWLFVGYVTVFPVTVRVLLCLLPILVHLQKFRILWFIFFHQLCRKVTIYFRFITCKPKFLKHFTISVPIVMTTAEKNPNPSLKLLEYFTVTV